MVVVGDDVGIRIQVTPIDRAARKENSFRALICRHRPPKAQSVELNLDAWLKDLAPSPGLMEWFSQASQQSGRFRDRYFRELESKPDHVRKLLDIAASAPVELICGAQQHELKAGWALRDFLRGKLSGVALTGAA